MLSNIPLVSASSKTRTQPEHPLPHLAGMGGAYLLQILLRALGQGKKCAESSVQIVILE
jgi:hypothetical protein